MKDDERKSRLHIHLGGLVILIIIILILLKVDIKSKIQSPQFQENISYIESQAKAVWQKYVSIPVKSRISNWLVETSNKELQKLQDNFSKKILKTDEIDKAVNETP